jgi:branched-chain amino acid transport system ATP-binding protein
LSLHFGGIQALSEVSFSVREGEIFAIIGPNGAGKTCLLNCISGYYRPQKGQTMFEGKDISRLAPHRVARRGISRTFQNLSLYPSLSVLDNLMAARFMHMKTNLLDATIYLGRSRNEEVKNRRIVEEIITFAHLEDLRHQPVATLSYGQRKRVEIARALTMGPRLLLLDEPMSGLDSLMKEMVARLVLDIQCQGTTVILIEHDMRVVMDLSQTIIVLDFGEKIAQGTPEDIKHNAAVAAAYLGKVGAEVNAS